MASKPKRDPLEQKRRDRQIGYDKPGDSGELNTLGVKWDIDDRKNESWENIFIGANPRIVQWIRPSEHKLNGDYIFTLTEIKSEGGKGWHPIEEEGKMNPYRIMCNAVKYILLLADLNSPLNKEGGADFEQNWKSKIAAAAMICRFTKLKEPEKALEEIASVDGIIRNIVFFETNTPAGAWAKDRLYWVLQYQAHLPWQAYVQYGIQLADSDYMLRLVKNAITAQSKDSESGKVDAGKLADGVQKYLEMSEELIKRMERCEAHQKRMTKFAKHQTAAMNELSRINKQFERPVESEAVVQRAETRSADGVLQGRDTALVEPGGRGDEDLPRE